MGYVYLFLCDVTYQFGQLAHDIQRQWFNREYWQWWGGIAVGSVLVIYQEENCMLSWNLGGGVLSR